MIALGRSRLALGRDVRLVSADEDVLWFESGVRLRPGQAVELVGPWPVPVASARARVISWRVIRIGGEGPIYRGCVRLVP